MVGLAKAEGRFLPSWGLTTPEKCNAKPLVKPETSVEIMSAK
jgi:hypothetical protein